MNNKNNNFLNNDLFKFWLDHVSIKDKEILLNQTDNEDAFYKSLEFGTAGLRGKMGIGPNRMNSYIVRKVSFAFYHYLLKQDNDLITKGIVISHDNRLHSRDFVLNVAEVFRYFGVKVYLFSDLRPTPVLSYAVRKLGCSGGVMITASHNTKEYNGYKVYDETGCQLTPDKIDGVLEELNKIDDLFSVPYKPLNDIKYLNICDSEVDEDYLEEVTKIKYNDLSGMDKDKVLFCYTPLHGTGGVFLPRFLDELGYRIISVKEQMVHDPLFSTVPSPNPENISAFEMASVLGKEKHADVLLANDPDADRMGVATYDEKIKDYHYLTGNQTGAIILDYLGKYAPKNKKGKDYVFNTIVTSEIAKLICKKYNLELKQTLTGFKYIGEQARLLEGTNDKFFFGYEESYGCVVKDFVRDKDALQACTILSEMAVFYKKQGKTLYDVLLDLYQEFGTFDDFVLSFTFEGSEGSKIMAKIMNDLRINPFKQLAGKRIIKTEDYESLESKDLLNNTFSTIQLPSSNVMKFYLENAGWICFRPSGTEPKLKIYLSIYEKDKNDTIATVKKLKEEMATFISSYKK